MPIYDHDGTTTHAISVICDNDGSAFHQIGKVYDNNGTTSSLIYQSAVSFTVANLSATAYSQYTYHAATATKDSATFTLDGHTTITCNIATSLSGNFRVDYRPGVEGGIYLLNSAGTVVRSSTFGEGTRTVTLDVSGLTGTYYLRAKAYCITQNINNNDGSTQTANFTVTASNISVNV